MPKIKLTKNELKRQKESLKRFVRYLPMLQLKKQQLQMEIIKVHRAIKKISHHEQTLRNNAIAWLDVFAEDVNIEEIIKFKTINVEEGNIAGVDIPIFSSVVFDEKAYDFMITPLWVDKGIQLIKETASLKAQLIVLHKQLDLLKEELRIVSQRVNLFEKIKIPETKENIRVIQIYLGDLQTASVVRGKIAKAKLEKKKELAVKG